MQVRVVRQVRGAEAEVVGRDDQAAAGGKQQRRRQVLAVLTRAGDVAAVGAGAVQVGHGRDRRRRCEGQHRQCAGLARLAPGPGRRVLVRDKAHAVLNLRGQGVALRRGQRGNLRNLQQQRLQLCGGDRSQFAGLEQRSGRLRRRRRCRVRRASAAGNQQARGKVSQQRRQQQPGIDLHAGPRHVNERAVMGSAVAGRGRPWFMSRILGAVGHGPMA